MPCSIRGSTTMTRCSHFLHSNHHASGNNSSGLRRENKRVYRRRLLGSPRRTAHSHSTSSLSRWFRDQSRRSQVVHSVIARSGVCICTAVLGRQLAECVVNKPRGNSLGGLADSFPV